MQRYMFYLTLLLILPFGLLAQIDHHETIIYDSDLWQYRVADSEPPANWMQPNFDDAEWANAAGGFGYGDDDDNTIINNPYGIYVRKEFNIIDLNHIEELILDADYDDGFVAYLNGVEVARSLVLGNPPAYNGGTITDHEAGLYQGGIPERFILDKNLLNNGTNTLAIQVVNFEPNSSDMTARFFLSVGINQAIYNYGEIPFWFETIPVQIDFTSSNLPLILIQTNGQEIPDEPKIIAQMGIVDNGVGNDNFLSDPFNHYDGQIAIELRGNSSQVFFDKKNYGFETQTEAGDNNNVPLLGMPAENDWVLHGPYSDKSLIRNVLSMHFGHLTGRWAPKTRLCELFIDDDYRGVYVLMEKIKRDKNRVDIATVNPADTADDELTGGYIFRIDWDSQGPSDGWESENGDYPYHYGVVEPKYDEMSFFQRNYIRNYVTQFEEAILAPNYLDVYKDYIDIGSLVDYFIVNELTKHIDAFKLSFYMYKTKDSNGGKINFGPIWDFNLGYGNYDFECSPDPSGWIYPCTSVTHWFDKLIQIDEVEDNLYCRWTELREGPYQTDSLIQFIDEQTDLLAEAQVRNFTRFPVLGEYIWPNSFAGNTYEEEINFLKNFLLLRLQWMDNAIRPATIGACSELTAVEETSISNIRVQTFPNPFIDHLSFEYSDETENQAELCIYTIDGQLHYKSAITNQESLNIDTQNWTSGTYIYNIHKDGNILFFDKLVK